MTVLRTLKDFDFDYFDSVNGEIEPTLKREAIKWIKQFNRVLKGEKDVIKNKYGLTICNIYGDPVDWIKHFFNISDEDLKE